MLPTLTTLPDFFVVDDGGFIFIKGHRIGLHHVIREYRRGLSADAISARFRTLKLSTIHHVLAFYLENETEVNHYCDTHDAEMDEIIRNHVNKGPTLEELKRRAEARQNAKAS
jgi:uncharacterized protein (DUF433 family)